MQPPLTLAGTEAVFAAFGHWPSFHDAEVVSFNLQRGFPVAASQPIATMEVHVREHEPTNVGTAAYELALTKNFIIRFVFKGIEELRVSEFNYQNVIEAITFSPAKESPVQALIVEVESIFGFGGSWRCRSAEVQSVGPGPSGKA